MGDTLLGSTERRQWEEDWGGVMSRDEVGEGRGPECGRIHVGNRLKARALVRWQASRDGSYRILE